MVKFPLTCLVVIFLIAIQCAKINLAMFAAGAVCGIVGPLAIATIAFKIMGVSMDMEFISEEEIEEFLKQRDKEDEDGDEEV